MHRRCGPAFAFRRRDSETRLFPRPEAGRPLPTGRSRSSLLRPCRSPSPPEPCAFASCLSNDSPANFPACEIACNKKAEPASPAFSESCFPKTHPCRTRPGTSRPTRAARSLSKAPDASLRAAVFRINPPVEPRQLQRRESRSAQAKTPQSSALLPTGAALTHCRRNVPPSPPADNRSAPFSRTRHPSCRRCPAVTSLQKARNANFA